jgi:hypothetical protein
MAVTDVTLDGLNINDGLVYVCGAPMLSALEAADPKEMVLLEMSARPPWFVRFQPRERSIPLIVFLLEGTYALRRVAWEALRAKLELNALISLRWTQDGNTKELFVGVSQDVTPDTWFHKLDGELLAPDPTPATV